MVAIINPFDAGGYSLAELIQAINILPNVYTRLGQMIVVQDGETFEETAILSPLRSRVRDAAEVVVAVPGVTPEARAAALDPLLVDLAEAIVADRTLGGAVEWAQPESPSFDDLAFDGAASVRATSMPVSLWFTTSETPLS
jgi:hypothetical protein